MGDPLEYFDNHPEDYNISDTLRNDLSYKEHNDPYKNGRRLRMRYFCYLVSVKSNAFYQYDMNFDVAVCGWEELNSEIEDTLEGLLPRIEKQMKWFAEKMGYTNEDIEALEEYYW